MASLNIFQLLLVVAVLISNPSTGCVTRDFFEIFEFFSENAKKKMLKIAKIYVMKYNQMDFY